MSGTTTATSRWLKATPDLPPLTDPAASTAERLVLLLHYGIDWSDQNWVTARRGDYWDNLLPSRIQSATYTSGASLNHWWTAASTQLGSSPRTAAERVELATLLAAAPKPVLQALRDQTAALTLRTRIVADAVRAQRKTTASSNNVDGVNV